jgi:hypothetical protein
MPLKAKHSLTTADWLNAIAHIEETISLREIEELTQKTQNEISDFTKGKKCGIAWSGGKDSQVIRYLCEPLGITDAVLCTSDLEYPCFVKWVNEFGPKGLYKWNPGLDLVWLSRHQDVYLFPKGEPQMHEWMVIMNWPGQDVFFREKGLDYILTGRRAKDNNYAGPNRNGTYLNRKGIYRYSPIYHWSHEQLLGYMHYNQITLPPVYQYIRGWMVATGPWPKRIVSTIEQGWSEVYWNDATVVYQAATVIQSARDYLEQRGHNAH